LCCSNTKPKPSDTKTPEQLAKTIFYMYGDKGLKNAGEEGLVNILDKTVKKGIDSVTVKEAYYDRSRISVALVAKSKDMIAKEFEYRFYYEGKLLPDSSRWMRLSKVIQNQQYDIVSLDVSSGFPGKFNLVIAAKKFGNSKNLASFEIPVDRASSDVITKEIAIMKTFTSNSRNVLVKNILFTPSSTTISYEYKGNQYDTLLTPALFDQRNKKVDTIGKGGLRSLGKSNNMEAYEYYDIYGPLGLDPGNLRMSFVFVDDAKNKVPVNAQFDIP
jgi:hypothetical protein